MLKKILSILTNKNYTDYKIKCNICGSWCYTEIENKRKFKICLKNGHRFEVRPKFKKK